MTRIVGARQTVFRSRFSDDDYAIVVEMVHELHATKGWRRIKKYKAKTLDRTMPMFQQQYVRAPSKKQPPRLDFLITEAVLMRHGWYRRQQRKINDQRIAEATA